MHPSFRASLIPRPLRAAPLSCSASLALRLSGAPPPRGGGGGAPEPADEHADEQVDGEDGEEEDVQRHHQLRPPPRAPQCTHLLCACPARVPCVDAVCACLARMPCSRACLGCLRRGVVHAACIKGFSAHSRRASCFSRRQPREYSHRTLAVLGSLSCSSVSCLLAHSIVKSMATRQDMIRTVHLREHIELFPDKLGLMLWSKLGMKECGWYVLRKTVCKGFELDFLEWWPPFP
jgi:hypothetical protein